MAEVSLTRRDWREWSLSALAVTTSAVHLYAPVFGAWKQLRIVSVMLFLLLVFLQHPLGNQGGGARRAVGRTADGLLLAATLAVGLVVIFTYDAFVERTGYLSTLDAVLGVLLIVTVLEATRRSMGWPLVILALAFIAFAHWGRHAPLVIAHGGAPWEDIVEFTFRNSAGIYGLPVAVMAGYVVLFIVIGSILEQSGAGEVMLDLAKAIAGGAVAGPAKMAVISSSLMGTISGSAVANVVTTGAFTIPLMKRTGLPAHFAGAVEAVASTGGIILPPVMGAVAFIAAQNVGIGYSHFIVAAALPAILYYLALYLFVDLEGRKAGLTGLDRSEVPPLGRVARRGWWIPLPFVLLVYMLMAGYSPARSAGLSLLLLALFVIGLNGWRRGAAIILRGLDQGSRATAPLMVAAAAAGIVIAMLFVSGIGLRFTQIIITLAQGNLPATLALVALVTLILGMGLPITAAYLTAAVLAVPALNHLAVPPLAAHMFVLYYSAISAITPPVALATFAAAGVARSGLWLTGLHAVRLGLTGYVVPFLFVYRPGLLLLGQPLAEAAYQFGAAALGLAALSIAAVGHIARPVPWPARLLLGGAGLLLVGLNNPWLDALGLLVTLAVAARYFTPHLKGR